MIPYNFQNLILENYKTNENTFFRKLSDLWKWLW